VFVTQTGHTFVFISDPLTTQTKELFDVAYLSLVEGVLRHPNYEVDHTGALQTITAKNFEVFAKRIDDCVEAFCTGRPFAAVSL
jgi:hypothetical protein